MVLQLFAGSYLAVLGVIDFWKKKISYPLLWIGGVLPLISILSESTITLRERIYGAVIGAGMILICVLTREAIGRADCLLILYLGITFGIFSCLSILGIASMLCCICCMCLLGFRLIHKKTRVPFIPFLFLGWLVVNIAGKFYG